MWPFDTLHALRREPDRIELDDSGMRLHFFGKCVSADYRDIGGLESVAVRNERVPASFMMSLSLHSGKRIGGFSENFVDFDLLLGEVRRCLAAAGTVAGGAEGARLARKRAMLWTQGGLYAVFFLTLMGFLVATEKETVRSAEQYWVMASVFFIITAIAALMMYATFRGWHLVRHGDRIILLRPGETLEDRLEKRP